MYRTAEHAASENPSLPGAALPGSPSAGATTPTTLADFKVIRRNGSVVGFEPNKIAIALTKAFLAVNGGQSAASARVREVVDHLTRSVVQAQASMRWPAPTCSIASVERRSGRPCARTPIAGPHRCCTWSMAAAGGRSMSAHCAR
jgi:ribonucleoside-diphosphate reductase alpha chain